MVHHILTKVKSLCPWLQRGSSLVSAMRIIHVNQSTIFSSIWSIVIFMVCKISSQSVVWGSLGIPEIISGGAKSNCGRVPSLREKKKNKKNPSRQPGYKCMWQHPSWPCNIRPLSQTTGLYVTIYGRQKSGKYAKNYTMWCVPGSVLQYEPRWAVPAGIKLLPGKKSLGVTTLCARIPVQNLFIILRPPPPSQLINSCTNGVKAMVGKTGDTLAQTQAVSPHYTVDPWTTHV